MAFPRYIPFFPFPTYHHATHSGASFACPLIEAPLPSQCADQLLDVAKVIIQRFGGRREVAGGDGRADLAVLLEAGFDPPFVVVREVVSNPVYLLLDRFVESDNPAVPAAPYDLLVEPMIIVKDR